MSDLRDTSRPSAQRYDDPALPTMRTLERRIRVWEMATGVLCVLFLWAPMAAAAFHRVG